MAPSYQKHAGSQAHTVEVFCSSLLSHNLEPTNRAPNKKVEQLRKRFDDGQYHDSSIHQGIPEGARDGSQVGGTYQGAYGPAAEPLVVGEDQTPTQKQDQTPEFEQKALPLPPAMAPDEKQPQAPTPPPAPPPPPPPPPPSATIASLIPFTSLSADAVSQEPSNTSKSTLESSKSSRSSKSKDSSHSKSGTALASTTRQTPASHTHDSSSRRISSTNAHSHSTSSTRPKHISVTTTRTQHRSHTPSTTILSSSSHTRSVSTWSSSSTLSTTDSTSVSGPTSTPLQDKSHHDGTAGRGSTGLVIAVVVLFSVAIIASIAWLFWRRRNRVKASSENWLDEAGAVTAPAKFRLSNKSWDSLDKPYTTSFDEKNGSFSSYIPPSVLSHPALALTRAAPLELSKTGASAAVKSGSAAAPKSSRPNSRVLAPRTSVSATAPRINWTLPSIPEMDSYRNSVFSSLPNAGLSDRGVRNPSGATAVGTTAMRRPLPQRNSSLPTSQSLAVNLDHADISRRNTTLTEKSEDTPVRYRSVNSWVKQQSGRVKREQERKSETSDVAAPKKSSLSFLPPVPDFRLMMPDNQASKTVNRGYDKSELHM